PGTAVRLGPAYPDHAGVVAGGSLAAPVAGVPSADFAPAFGRYESLPDASPADGAVDLSLGRSSPAAKLAYSRRRRGGSRGLCPGSCSAFAQAGETEPCLEPE